MAPRTGHATQIVVVGAGPVGLLLAGELRLGGARVTVLERRTEPSTESRASTLHARTMELLDQRGLLAAVGSPPKDPMGHFGGLPLDLGEQRSRYPGQWKVPQTELVAILTRWALGLGAEVRMGHEVSALTESRDGVVVRYQGPEVPDGSGELAAAFVVGCDGEDSTIRELAGIAFPGRDARRELVRADVTGIDVPNRRFQRLPAGLAVAATRAGVTRVMVHEFGAEAEPRTDDPGFEEIAKTWHRVTGEDISHGVPTWRNAFGDARRQAEYYRRGRVLLAGDAAHRQMPIGGQALNLGLQDAANLGWKLAAEVRGTAPPGLLDSYHTERHQVGRAVLDNIEAQATLLLGGPEIEPVRTLLAELLGHEVVRTRLGAAVAGLDIRYGEGHSREGGGEGACGGSDVVSGAGEGTFASSGGDSGIADHHLLGRRMPHLALSGAIGPDQGVGPESTAAALRPARGVLLDLSGQARRRMALSRIASGWSDRVDLIAARAVVPGGGDSVPDTVPDTVLIRPDGYVAWAAGRDGDPRAALAHWFGPYSPNPANRWE